MHIQTISHVRTAGKEEIFTEVSSFFMNKSEYRSLLRAFLTFTIKYSKYETETQV